jgi:hypothetical protein
MKQKLWAAFGSIQKVDSWLLHVQYKTPCAAFGTKQEIEAWFA